MTPHSFSTLYPRRTRICVVAWASVAALALWGCEPHTQETLTELSGVSVEITEIIKYDWGTGSGLFSGCVDLTFGCECPYPGYVFNLRLAGKAIRQVTHWGPVDIESAVTGYGESLAPQDFPNLSGIPTLSRIGRLGSKRDPEELHVCFRLELPTGPGKSLRTLRGSVHLELGETRTIRFDVKDLAAGMLLAAEAIEAAGVVVRVAELPDLQSDGAAESNELVLHVSGQDENLVGAGLEDETGQPLNYGYSGGPLDKGRYSSFRPTRRLRSSDRLRLTLAIVDRQAVVPFELSDVELPQARWRGAERKVFSQDDEARRP